MYDEKACVAKTCERGHKLLHQEGDEQKDYGAEIVTKQAVEVYGVSERTTKTVPKSLKFTAGATRASESIGPFSTESIVPTRMLD